MAEPKSRRITFAIEDTLYGLVFANFGDEYGTISEYMRALILRDIKERGLLTESVLLKLVVGENGTLAPTG